MSLDQEKIFLDSIVDSVIMIDKEGRIRDVNQGALDLLGYPRSEEIIMSPFEKICQNLSMANLRDKIPLAEQELVYLHKEGRGIPVSVNITSRVSYPDDLIFIGRNMKKVKELIGELTQSQQELKTSYDQLETNKNDLVRSEKLAYAGRISASIAHEIRNPLTNVSMSVQQLKKNFKKSERESKHLAIIERNTERINFLITELLNSARPSKLSFHPSDIHHVLKEVLDSVHPKIQSGKIKVIKDFTPSLSLLKIDKEQIGRVLLNLILNAIEAMPQGGTLTIATGHERNHFKIKIVDTGKGISEENLIKVFDPFFSTKQGGVGLGLTICYGIIASHGGAIEVESKSKKGSIFILSLPLAAENKTDRQTDRQGQKIKTSIK